MISWFTRKRAPYLSRKGPIFGPFFLEPAPLGVGWRKTFHPTNKETIMKLMKTLLMTAAVAVLSTGAMAADGSANTDGTHNANNTQTDTNMGVNANKDSSNDAAANINANASTEAEMSDTSNDVNTSTDINTTADANAQVSLDRATVQSVQASLKNEGHSVSVDGVWGPRTAAALRNFQEANNLPATGTLDSQTMAALDIR
jgi:hypothetical protein